MTTSSSFNPVLSRLLTAYLERGRANHPTSGKGKYYPRAMAESGLLPTLLAMKTNTSRRASEEVELYVQLQQQMHDALRRQHPEWIQPNGESPMCDAYETRLAELLCVPSQREQRIAA